MDTVYLFKIPNPVSHAIISAILADFEKEKKKKKIHSLTTNRWSSFRHQFYVINKKCPSNTRY